MSRIVVVGAHTDDVEYGCGGTIYQLTSRGNEVVCLILSDGKRGGHDRKEAYAAAEILGISQLYFGEFPDGDIPESAQVKDFLKQYIRNDVDVVFGPVPTDINPDHRNTANMVLRVATLVVSKVLLYEGPRNSAFKPNYYQKLREKDVKKKIEAYDCYRSQEQKGHLFHDIDAMARFRGARSALGLSEGFEVHSILMPPIGEKLSLHNMV